MPAATRFAPSRRAVVIGALACGGSARHGAQRRRARTPSPCTATPAWGPGFTHPTYANPSAPKGGRLTQGVLGTFDSLNPFIVQGLPAANLRSYVIESLLARGYDEPFTLYGLLASTVETDAARSMGELRDRSAARFSDGTPVTPDDVIFSWALAARQRPAELPHLLRQGDQGRGGRRTRRALRSDRRRRPRVAVDPRPDAGAGASRGQFRHIRKHELCSPARQRPLHGRRGRSRARPSPSSATRNIGAAICRSIAACGISTTSVSTITATATLISRRSRKAFTICALETDPGRWQTAYDFPAAREGRVVKEAFPYGLPKGMQGLVMNTRRADFADIRVREALLYLFDFEWLNHNYFFDLYKRTASYFDGCDSSAHGVPANARERELLAPFPDAVRADIMDGTWEPPKTDGSGPRPQRPAPRLRAVRAGRLRAQRHAADASRQRAPFALRDSLHYPRAGARGARLCAQPQAGRHRRARAQWSMRRSSRRRRIAFDFDMMEYRWEQSLSPGNEQSFYWGSAAAGEEGSRNYMGVKSKAIDAMIAAMLAATERDDFVAAIRALDRVLLSGFYVVPLYYPPAQWVARWKRVEHPAHLAVRLLAGNLVAGARSSARHDRCAATPRHTLDDLFRRAGVRPPTRWRWSIRANRLAFTDGAPRRLTYAQADRAIGAIAARLRQLGLATDAVVALQLPNTVESVLALLGILRAGMIAAPLPLLWHRQDADRGAALHRRQGDPHLRARRRRRAGRDRHAGGRRAVFHPPCLRFRRGLAGRRGPARRCVRRRTTRREPAS